MTAFMSSATMFRSVSRWRPLGVKSGSVPSGYRRWCYCSTWDGGCFRPYRRRTHSSCTRRIFEELPGETSQHSQEQEKKPALNISVLSSMFRALLSCDAPERLQTPGGGTGSHLFNKFIVITLITMASCTASRPKPLEVLCGLNGRISLNVWRREPKLNPAGVCECTHTRAHTLRAVRF